MTATRKIDTAMVLAAGLGRRMRPITDDIPKPLVRVAGRPLIDYALDSLRSVGITRAVVNVHHLANQVVDHLKTVDGMSFAVSDETDGLLDSGGGVVRALPHLGDEPFVLLNADTFWIDDPVATGNLRRMIDRFDPGSMDILMLVVAPENATGHEGRGDFTMDGQGRLRRYGGMTPDPVIYAGALVLHPRAFENAPDGPFSLNRCFDAALLADRMRGIELVGHWLTVGAPGAITAAERAIDLYRTKELRTA